MLVFWSASSKELQRDEKKEKYRWNPQKTLETPVLSLVSLQLQGIISKIQSITGCPSPGTTTEGGPGKHVTAQYWAAPHQAITRENRVWGKRLLLPQYHHSAETADPVLFCKQLRTEPYPSLQPSRQQSHLLWCWPHGCCSPRAAGPKRCSRGQRAPPSPCASSSAWPELGCCLQTPGAHWTACAGTLQMAEMGLWGSSSPEPRPAATGLPESFMEAARNTRRPEEQYILQAPLTPTPDSAMQQTGS